MSPRDERFHAKVTVLMESVEHHLGEEEDGWFPKVRDQLGRTALQEIGAAMLAARKDAPTRPAQPGALRKTVDALLHR